MILTSGIGKLLLLDLDGVLVTDGDGDTRIGCEIITVHQQLLKQLNSLRIPVAILTHRSRCEALQIIQALGLSRYDFHDIFTANDILVYGLRFKGICFLINHGSKKSIILHFIQKHYNIPPRSVAFIDDRLCNVEDLINEGIGLGINVPAAKVIDGKKIVTFDFNSALETVKNWCEHSGLSNDSPILVQMPSVTIDLPVNAFSGSIIRRQWTDFFGLGRSGLRFSRQCILRLLK
ncbi:MAG: HAD family hydrolase [Methylococcales bacterium]